MALATCDSIRTADYIDVRGMHTRFVRLDCEGANVTYATQ